ncbi:HARBI1 [Mytilus coruscus]|uniref:Putative nuclease HARBI1 n=1 Tax=Mytilus coruscus TaxID=42192 RepID=A0A6J8CPU4_MYTCO|nr:HARBI1 [Mytilus coruscus]
MLQRVIGMLFLLHFHQVYGTGSCTTYVCFNWKVTFHELKLICKVNTLHFNVRILDQYGTEQGYCITPTPTSKCEPYYKNGTLSQNTETNETTFIVHGKIDYRINGNWTCLHGRQRDTAQVEVTVLRMKVDKPQSKMAVNVLFQPHVVRRERHFRGFDPLQREFTDEELRQRYRFGRETIEYLSDLMRADLERGTNKETELSVEQQILIALRFYGSGSQLQVVGDTMGFDKSIVSRVIDHVTEALVARKDQFISWPDNQRKNIIRAGFYEKAGFSNVVGCIDGTHIRITGTSVDEPVFVNRKGFHINVQANCDHEGRFTNISARWPGSAHDSHIFRTSAIGQHLENGYHGIGQGVLLGDSDYPCRQFLLTPYRQPAAGRGQARFNRRHCSIRSTIERTFGIWNKRFHILGSEIKLAESSLIVDLHNIAIMRNEPDVAEEQLIDNQPQMPPYNGQQDGKGIRDHFPTTFLPK